MNDMKINPHVQVSRQIKIILILKFKRKNSDIEYRLLEESSKSCIQMIKAEDHIEVKILNSPNGDSIGVKGSISYPNLFPLFICVFHLFE